MTHEEKRVFLIEKLLSERREYRHMRVPGSLEAQKQLLRSLMNVRPPRPVSDRFLEVQDEYLWEASAERGITDLNRLTPVRDGLYLWQGDITTLRCDAIVNAANAQMLGCFCPCHGCIDNAIHTYSGVQLRLACAELMRKQGHEEATGTAKITPAYNLPCKYVLHTVGPIIYGPVTPEEEGLLASCYRSCLELAEENGIKSIAFCCISTGEFHFPPKRAAEIAVQTVLDYLEANSGIERVVFNVFKDADYQIYRKLLVAD